MLVVETEKFDAYIINCRFEESVGIDSRIVGWRSEQKRDETRFSLAINFGTFMQRRSPRINEKDERVKNMDGLSYFKHVAIVALDFPTNPGAKESTDIRGTMWEDRKRELEIFGPVSAGASASYLLPK